MLIGFEWDANKARKNLQEHHISFDEACTVFDDPLSSTRNDPDHSSEELRFVTMGHSERGNVLVVCHCDREPNIRVISARLANVAERRSYESDSH